MPACMALTARKGHAASVRRQSRQRLRSERRYRRNRFSRFYRQPVRIGSIAPGPAVPSPTTLRWQPCKLSTIHFPFAARRVPLQSLIRLHIAELSRRAAGILAERIGEGRRGREAAQRGNVPHWLPLRVLPWKKLESTAAFHRGRSVSFFIISIAISFLVTMLISFQFAPEALMRALY